MPRRCVEDAYPNRDSRPKVHMAAIPTEFSGRPSDQTET